MEYDPFLESMADELSEAREELGRLRAEVSRYRAALEKIIDETAGTWVCDTPRAALAYNRQSSPTEAREHE